MDNDTENLKKSLMKAANAAAFAGVLFAAAGELAPVYFTEERAISQAPSKSFIDRERAIQDHRSGELAWRFLCGTLGITLLGSALYDYRTCRKLSEPAPE